MHVWMMINSAGLIVVAGVVLLMARQIGFILNRVGPMGARTLAQGPRRGENISFHVQRLGEGGGVPTLYIFASGGCPICIRIVEAAAALSRHWKGTARIVVVHDTLTEDQETIPAPDNGTFASVVGGDLRQELDIRTIPYAVMTDAECGVLGHGLVNSADQIESLLYLVEEPQDTSSRETKDLLEEAVHGAQS